MQYRQEKLVFELIKTVSIKDNIWHYQVHDVKFESLQKTRLQIKHRKRNIKTYPLQNTDQMAITVSIFTGKIPSK